MYPIPIHDHHIHYMSFIKTIIRISEKKTFNCCKKLVLYIYNIIKFKGKLRFFKD